MFIAALVSEVNPSAHEQEWTNKPEFTQWNIIQLSKQVNYSDITIWMNISNKIKKISILKD